jgi:hypothetical protein
MRLRHPWPSTTTTDKPARRMASGLAALALCAGGAALCGLIGPAASSAGAANPAPTMSVLNYTGNSLTTFPFGAGGNTAPSVTVSTGPAQEPWSAVYDAAGDLWVARYVTATLVEYTAAQLASSGTPTPVVTIHATFTDAGPSGLAFDSAGDLWMTNYDGPIVEYTAAQLKASGSPTPAVLISGTAARAWGLTFDNAGNLWAGGYDEGSNLVEYSANQLTASGSPTPAVTISGISEPVAPTFDASGNLWVTSFDGQAVDKFTPAQLTTSGSPTPAVQISGANTTFSDPTAIAFDTAGDLWVPNYTGNSLVEFTPNQLTSTGDPTPADTLAGGDTTIDGAIQVLLNQPAAVTSVTPSSGKAGTTVTIAGSGFRYGASVSFGAIPATSVTYVSPHELQAVVPNGAGTVDVTVTMNSGTSATSAADQFTYAVSGYVEAASDGGIFNYGAPFYGSMGGQHLNAPIVGVAGDPATGGYWEVASDGGVFNFNAPFFGSMGAKHLNAPIVGMAATADGEGYWLVAKDGGIFAFGDALFYGSRGGQPLNAPVVGIADDPATGGYWEVASDGGIFSYNAPFLGSRGGQKLNAPVVGIASAANGGGYWEVASDGGIFNYGTAGFLGSRGGQPLNAPVVGIAADGATGGYWLVASDGGIFNYGAPFLGSRGGQHLNAPVVGAAGT